MFWEEIFVRVIVTFFICLYRRIRKVLFMRLTLTIISTYFLLLKVVPLRVSILILVLNRYL